MWRYKRLFKKWAELFGALPRHRQKRSLTYPKTYARSAFLAASNGTWDKIHCTLGLSHVPLPCANQPCPLFEQAP